MAVLPVCTWGHPVLKTRAKEITEITNELRNLVKDMFDTLKAERGVGLAANQVGEAIRVFVVDVPVPNGDPRRCAIINPEITYKSKKKEVQDEGCLSFPGIYGPVERLLEVEVQGKDLEGNLINVRGSGLLARAIQHELDHLDGIVFVEKMNIIHRMGLNKELKALARKTRASLVEQRTKKY